MKAITKLYSIILIVLLNTFCLAQNKQLLPLIDISQEINSHVIIADGTEDIYQGHPEGTGASAGHMLGTGTAESLSQANLRIMYQVITKHSVMSFSLF